MKEKLIELLMSAERNAEEQGFFNCHKSKVKAECIADYFLTNGVIVPPCKVGDTVYVDSDTWGYDYLYFESRFIHSKYFLVGEIVSIIKTKKQLLMKIRVSNSIHTRYKHKRYTVNVIGKTVFFTKEEAEKALREREENGK